MIQVESGLRLRQEQVQGAGVCVGGMGEGGR